MIKSARMVSLERWILDLNTLKEVDPQDEVVLRKLREAHTAYKLEKRKALGLKLIQGGKE